MERFGEEVLPDKKLLPPVLHVHLVVLYRNPAAMCPLRELLRVEMQLQRNPAGGEIIRVYVSRQRTVLVLGEIPPSPALRPLGGTHLLLGQTMMAFKRLGNQSLRQEPTGRPGHGVRIANESFVAWLVYLFYVYTSGKWLSVFGPTVHKINLKQVAVEPF